MADKPFLKTFVDLETADTQKERQKGLQGREKLDQHRGMLFKYDELSQKSIWMKDTHIPLDIIFLSEDGTVLNIEQGEPMNKEHIKSKGENCMYVLEFNEGKTDDFNISEGDNLSFLL